MSSGFFNQSSILYHGTAAKVVPKILNSGLKPTKCQLSHGGKAVYLTPSIRYAAHPRYSRVYSDAQGCYYQLVLEVRVHNTLLDNFKNKIHPGNVSDSGNGYSSGASCASGCEGETMRVNGNFRIDPNIPNDRMECLLKSRKRMLGEEDGVVVTGIMMRKVHGDPMNLTESSWWTEFAPAHELRECYYIAL
mmetsp:Transcript_20701/g.66185  ORF Transcript_20701/g.66185 Transcript_20701/m.66185 type:complete len:191 (-) Transcript_20701:135-707(-)